MAGGGTGGHIFPLIAVAQELKKETQELGIILDMRYFGDAYEYAQEIVDNDIEFIPIISSKLRRYWSLLNIIDAIKFFISLFQLLWKIFWFMPDVVFSKGGPGALAVILVSRFYMLPVVVHDSDSIPGLTNKISGNLAEKIFLAFPSAKEYFSVKSEGEINIEIVGNPVRESLLQQAASLDFGGEDKQSQAKKGFGLGINVPVIFIWGGSQGAEALNSFVLENLEILVRSFQIIHQIGSKNYDEHKKDFEFMAKDWNDMEKNRYIFRPFLRKDLSDAFIAADIVVARASAGSIFEIAAFGRPSILIPLPNSANGHQANNAHFYNQSGATVVIQQENLLGNLFIKELERLINDRDLLKKMSEAAKNFYKPDAAKIIAGYLLNYVS